MCRYAMAPYETHYARPADRRAPAVKPRVRLQRQLPGLVAMFDSGRTDLSVKAMDIVRGCAR
ncbi:hypothetical protein [Micromonospora sp. NPDC005652]|uniref:hypothetical protein n=1 Tax=Micromonospora sp. NPDC005652 TaxID=3157046 RepID=UPI0033E8489C